MQGAANTCMVSSSRSRGGEGRNLKFAILKFPIRPDPSKILPTCNTNTASIQTPTQPNLTIFPNIDPREPSPPNPHRKDPDGPSLPPMPSKRVQVELDDGWSVITHKSPSPSPNSHSHKSPSSRAGTARRKDPSHPQPRRNDADIATAFAQLRLGAITPREYNDSVMARTLPNGPGTFNTQRVVEGLAVANLAAEFAKLQRVWRACECRAALLKLLANARGEGEGDGDAGWGITSAVAFGTGSFSLDWENRARALWQLVLFVDVVELVKKTGETKLFAQDPLYTPLDHHFLETLGIAVKSSTAKSHLTRGSFLYVPFVDWRILNLVILPGTDPRLYIG
ncbi:uncharacterized protein BDZ99DRAFT_500396, partial [Mytilinidion resinicola]